jgi:hypothetical protein
MVKCLRKVDNLTGHHLNQEKSCGVNVRWESDWLIFCLWNQMENLPPGRMPDYNSRYLQSKLEDPDAMLDDATGEKMSLPSILDLFLASTDRVMDPNVCGEHYTDVWVLRNPTRNLYVRSNGIPTTDCHGDRPGLRYENHSGYWGVPGLAQALMLRVAWLSCPDTGMVLQDKIPFHQGAWVGDRFDIYD